MRRKEQRSMLALGIVMAFVVGVFWAGPVGAGGGNPCAAIQAVADRLGCELGESDCTDAPVEKTGQTECYDANGGSIDCAETGQDGDLQKGVAWPEPRFTDNEDGTVTDNLTGLMWAQNANADGAKKIWSAALTYCNDLNLGGYTDWRLPNVKELQSLIHYGVYDPAVPNTAGTDKWSEGDPFSGVESDDYWSSTTYANLKYIACFALLNSGIVGLANKDYDCYVWPVRGGQ